MKAQASLELMLALASLITLLTFLTSTIFQTTNALNSAQQKMLAYQKAQSCALVASSLAANPEARIKEGLECKYAEGMMVEDFNNSYVACDVIGELHVEQRKGTLTLIAYGSHYR